MYSPKEIPVPKLYFLLRWKTDQSARGWSRYEVRPMDAIETDARYDIVDQGLTFDEADRRREQLERKEARDHVNR